MAITKLKVYRDGKLFKHSKIGNFSPEGGLLPIDFNNTKDPKKGFWVNIFKDENKPIFKSLKKEVEFTWEGNWTTDFKKDKDTKCTCIKKEKFHFRLVFENKSDYDKVVEFFKKEIKRKPKPKTKRKRLSKKKKKTQNGGKKKKRTGKKSKRLKKINPDEFKKMITEMEQSVDKDHKKCNSVCNKINTNYAKDKKKSKMKDECHHECWKKRIKTVKAFHKKYPEEFKIFVKNLDGGESNKRNQKKKEKKNN